MALPKALCWALMFIIRIQFPPGTSLAIQSVPEKSDTIESTLSHCS